MTDTPIRTHTTTVAAFYVLAPAPVPAPPATETKVAEVIQRYLGGEYTSGVASNDGALIARRLADAGLLVEAPTGDDGPQADTPAPQGRWIEDMDLIEPTPMGLVHQLHEAVYGDSWARPETPRAVWGDLLTTVRDLVRRDRTPDPTAEEVYEWLFQSQLVEDATEMVWDGLDDDEVDRIRDVLAAVRALREGGR